LKITKEFKIGVLAVITILLVIWGLNFLKGKDIFSQQIIFYAIYDDVTGLIESNPVSINGVSIGQVNKIRFMPDGSGKILVENIINQDVPIPVNSISKLTGASLTGSREIIIELGDAGQYIQNGDTLLAETQISLQDEVSELVMPIKQRAEDLFAEVDSILTIFQAIFNEQTKNNITQSFTNLEETLSNIKNTTSKLDETIESETTRISNIMENAESISANLKDNNETLTNILNNFSSVSDSLAAANIKKTLLDAEKSITSLNEIMDKINRGEGSVGLLVNDENLYQNLENSSKQLELLLEEIRKNPGNYIKLSVFGR
jgi:phospholipid/cholesterol/gamma-HCH transport system substrate-binding protein